MTDDNANLLCMLLNEAWPGQWIPDQTGIPGRLYRFDAQNPGLNVNKVKVAVEIDGGMLPKNEGELKCSFCGRTCKNKLALWTHSNSCGIKDISLPWKNQIKLNTEG